MRLKPRGTYKTTLYGVALILWLWGCFTPELRIFYTSSNSLLLEEVSDKLNQFVGNDRSDTLYSEIFGITRDSVAKNTSDVFNIKGRSGKGFSLILRTSGGSTVGIHPNIILIDDPLGQKDRESQAERDSKESWFDTLNPLLVPYRYKKGNLSVLFESIYYIGTRWHFKDLINHILENNEKKKLGWDIEIESIYTPDRHSAYPDLWTDEQVIAKKATMSDIFWNCQYENNPLPEGSMVFNLKKLHFIRPEQFDVNIGQNIAIFDPSLGKTHSDYPAVWWLNFNDNRITFFDAIDDKVEISRIVHMIAERNRRYNVGTLVYEDNGILLVDKALKEAHERIGWKIYLKSVHHSSNKDERIISMQPELYSGFVVFMSDYITRYPEAMNQITFYPAYGYDDFPDCAQIGVEYFRQPHFKFIRYESIL